MTKERLEEVLQNIIEWGMNHDDEFMECLVNAMDLSEKEVKELELEEYADNYDDEDIDFYDAKDILDSLDLDDTAYDYYLEAMQGIYYNDLASHETHGYTSIRDVLNDAKSCEEANNYDEDEEEEQ